MSVTPHELLKLQWPLLGEDRKILIYNQSRSTYALMPVAMSYDVKVAGCGTLRALLRRELKVYVLGHIDQAGRLVIGEVVGGADYGDVCGW